MKDFNELLEDIRKEPSKYLKWYSIFAFQSFYNGYCMAQKMYNLSKTQQQQEFEDFLTWIETDNAQRYMNINRTWPVVVFATSSNERKALDDFFELFEQYLEEKNNP